MFTPEQSAALLNSQAALLNAEIAGMVAENQFRAHRGEAPAYTEDAFQNKINECWKVLRLDMARYLLINGELAD